MFKSLKRKSLPEKILYCFVSLIFAAVAFSYVYILFWMFMSGAKTHTEVALDTFGLPTVWHWENYRDVMSMLEVNGVGFWNMLFNSLWWSIIPVTLSIFTQCTFSYTCSKYKFPTSTWPYLIILVVMTLPIYGAGGASYRLGWRLGLINNMWAAFMNISGFSASYLYFNAYFKNLSWTYAEAAQIDGANDFQVYFRVMLPQAMPLLTALGITSWIAQWNDYTYILINQPKTPTLPVGIYNFNLEMTYRARLDILFAACFYVCIPCIILFIVFNKTITTNVSLGGIKG
ncbi:MAG: carbohydrate ABC transporter permease [Oscillospiraceae bacterium]|nr:carbohydrate ABC transporter permease [Oscillospiraceae bacterium]